MLFPVAEEAIAVTWAEAIAVVRAGDHVGEHLEVRRCLVLISGEGFGRIKRFTGTRGMGCGWSSWVSVLVWVQVWVWLGDRLKMRGHLLLKRRLMGCACLHRLMCHDAALLAGRLVANVRVYHRARAAHAPPHLQLQPPRLLSDGGGRVNGWTSRTEHALPMPYLCPTYALPGTVLTSSLPASLHAYLHACRLAPYACTIISIAAASNSVSRRSRAAA